MIVIDAVLVVFLVGMTIYQVGRIRKMIPRRPHTPQANQTLPPPCPRCGQAARARATRWELDEDLQRSFIWRRIVCAACGFDEWMQVASEARPRTSR
ncbi:MAG: hypothetical protein EXR58_06175 [Chloroflexi bacterium]|nr:hypothetical protein [Chloroflexota bacterium]